MPVAQSWLKCQNAEFNTRLESSTCVVSAHGELDAANADQLAECVVRAVKPECVARAVKHCRLLTLDLSDLDFIGTAGFSALHRVNVVCSAAEVRWAMVPSRAVSRLLRICDPDGVLPVAESAQQSEPEQPRLLQLIP